jgi:hypothetical protein
MRSGSNNSPRFLPTRELGTSGAPAFRCCAKRGNRALLFLMLISCLAMSGCPPPRASLLIRDDHGPYKTSSVRSMTYGDAYYSVQTVYSIDELNARLADDKISSIEMILSDDTEIRGDSVSIVDGSALLIAEERMRGEYGLSRINRLVLYETIPFSERRDRFLTPFILMTLISAVGAVSTDDYSDIWIGPLIGAGLGIPQFLVKSRTTERIFNFYDPEVEANAVVRLKNY